MSTNNWKRELDDLMEIFQCQSESSLRKISESFLKSGLPFDEEFRRYYLNMSALRLDSSFNTILLEQWDANRMLRMVSSSSAGINSIAIANHTNILSSVHTMTFQSHLNFGMASMNESMFRMNALSNSLGPIEVDDDDDEHVVADQQIQKPIGAIKDRRGSTSSPDGYDDDLNADNEADAPVVDSENDASLLGFIPIQDIHESETEHDAAISTPFAVAPTHNHHQQQQQPHSAPTQMRPRRVAVKRSVCICCQPTQDYRNKPKQRPHRQSLPNIRLNVANADQNAVIKLFECTQCDLKFTKFAYLSIHRTKVHLNGKLKNRRLFNCTHCMRRFTSQHDRNWHETGCENRRFECYLCKVYVSRDRIHMEKHIRTHSGDRPFLCAVCGKYFGSKSYLERHISFHARKK